MHEVDAHVNRFLSHLTPCLLTWSVSHEHIRMRSEILITWSVSQITYEIVENQGASSAFWVTSDHWILPKNSLSGCALHQKSFATALRSQSNLKIPFPKSNSSVIALFSIQEIITIKCFFVLSPSILVFFCISSAPNISAITPSIILKPVQILSCIYMIGRSEI